MPLAIGNSVGIPFSRRAGGGFVGLLDEVSGAAFAASVRLLRADYSGGLARVIAYDGSTQFGAADIMPYLIGDEYWLDLNSTLENLDATAIGRGLTTSDTLADLVSVGVNDYDGLVPTWYGQQAGATLNATQANVANMPKIVNAGALVAENGKPMIGGVQDNKYMITTYGINGTSRQVSFVGKYGLPIRSCMLGSSSTSDLTYLGDDSGSSNTANSIINSTRINGVLTTVNTRALTQSTFTPQVISFSNVDFNYASNAMQLGYSNAFGGWDMFSSQELVIWESAVTANTVETNQNNAFNIYP